MYIITKAFRLFAPILLLALSACGGGGGGGGGGPSLSLSTNTMTFTATQGSMPASQTVTATINGNVSGTLYILIMSTGQAVGSISNVMITGPRTGEATVSVVTSLLAVGTYTGTITVTACTSGPTCSSGVVGTPQTINVTYNVT